MLKIHAEHVPLSATAKRLRLHHHRLGVTRGVGAAMASCTWSDEETFVPIEIWGEDSIQAMLEGTRRNKDVFVKIAKAIEERGFTKSAVQCSAKIKRLRLSTNRYGMLIPGVNEEKLIGNFTMRWMGS